MQNAEENIAQNAEQFGRNAERLLDTFGNAILRMAYSYLHNMSDAEEILQETLIRYLTVQPELQGPEHEKAWLLRVAANLSKNRLDYNRLRDTDELEETLVSQE
ncbi:MAG: RNA polymerase sigma factor [Clostridium sp.]